MVVGLSIDGQCLMGPSKQDSGSRLRSLPCVDRPCRCLLPQTSMCSCLDCSVLKCLVPRKIEISALIFGYTMYSQTETSGCINTGAAKLMVATTKHDHFKWIPFDAGSKNDGTHLTGKSLNSDSEKRSQGILMMIAV